MDQWSRYLLPTWHSWENASLCFPDCSIKDTCRCSVAAQGPRWCCSDPGWFLNSGKGAVRSHTRTHVHMLSMSSLFACTQRQVLTALRDCPGRVLGLNDQLTLQKSARSVCTTETLYFGTLKTCSRHQICRVLCSCCCSFGGKRPMPEQTSHDGFPRSHASHHRQVPLSSLMYHVHPQSTVLWPDLDWLFTV